MSNNIRISYSLQYLIFIVGFMLLLLGLFMVTDVHTWKFFDVWLPMGLIIVGLIMSVSKIYSNTLGMAFLFLGMAVWLHQVWIVKYHLLTLFIDWTFVAVGCLTMLGALLWIWVKGRNNRYVSDKTHDLA